MVEGARAGRIPRTGCGESTVSPLIVGVGVRPGTVSVEYVDDAGFEAGEAPYLRARSGLRNTGRG